MSGRTVLVTDPIGGDASVIANALAPLGISTLTPAPNEDWRTLAHLADGLIVNLARIDAGALGKLERCRVIARLGVGVNNIDLDAARARGMIITNVPDYCRDEVSEHALALILAIVRQLPIANGDVQRGFWKQLGYRPIHRLSALTLGLIGFGRIAQALARKADALSMRIVAHDPLVNPATLGEVPLMNLDETLATADVISLHVPLSAQTHHLIGRQELLRMKRGAFLVNTSRGGLVDEAALVAALDDGHLSAVALDVMETEPLSATSALRGRANVLLTPHMAFYSEESLVTLQRSAAEDVVRVLSGQPPHYLIA